MERATIRRLGILAGAGLLGLAFASSPGRSQDKGPIVIASFGGKFQDGQRMAYFKPFEEATGIKVVEASYSSIAQLKTMEMSNDVEWDVFDVVPSAFYLMLDDGYLEKIDYTKFDKKLLDEMDPHVLHPYGFGGLFFSHTVSFNTRSFPPGHRPHSWADVWDTANFPGKREMPAGNWDGVSPYEMALLADGVPPDKLYPIDLDRAFHMFDKLRPSVVKWVNSASAPPQALVDGEADLGDAAQARIGELKAAGAPVDFDWNQGLITSDFWAVPKGAKHYDLALKFIAFASSAEAQARLVKQLPFGPTNRRALDFLSPAEQSRLASNPDNLKQQIFLKPAFWAERDGAGQTWFDRAVARWNAWMLQ